MRFRWIAIVQLYACAALATEPGKDFSVNITWPIYAQRLGQGDTVPVHAEIRGCDQARIEVMSRQNDGTNSTPWQRQAANFLQTPDGTYTTEVDLLEHVGKERMACWSSVDRPLSIELQVVATCQGDGREAVSQTLPVQFSPADFAAPAWLAEQFVVVDANRLLILGNNYFALQSTWPVDTNNTLGGVGGIWALDAPRQAVGLNGYPHEVSVAGTRAYVSDACVFPHCHPITATDPVTGVQLTAQNSTIYRIDTTANDGNLVSGLLEVPGRVVRMLPDRDGSILVLSISGPPIVPGLDGFGLAVLAPGWFLSRIDGNVVTSLEVNVDSHIEMYGSGGELVVSRAGDAYRLHNLRFVHESQKIIVPSAPPPSQLGVLYSSGRFSVSPQGTQWTISQENGLWLHDGMRTSQIFTPPQNSSLISTSWQNDTLAVSYRIWADEAHNSPVKIFDRHTGAQVGEFDFPWKMLGFDIGQLTALSGGRFAATNSSNAIAILDERGNILGTTRIPHACGSVRWLQELPDGRLVWLGGQPLHMQTLYFWDIRPYTNHT